MTQRAVADWANRFFKRAGPAEPSPLYQFGAARPGKVALVVLLGRDPAALSHFVPAAETKLRRFARRVYLTDSDDLSPFSRAGAVVEVLPRPGDLIGPADPILVRTYLHDRYRLVLAKWEPTIVLNYGIGVEELLSEIHADAKPLEDEF